MGRLLLMDPELVLLTMGGKGAKLFTPTSRYEAKVYSVPVRDTTGAGDCFHAAFLSGLLSDWDLQYCLDFASAAAAIMIQEIGARKGLPTATQI
jgi:sulfofructose kinase